MNSGQVAEIIARQLGGSNRLKVMVNARDFVHGVEEGKPYLGFRYGFRGADTPYNYIKIALNSRDLYDVTFLRIYAGQFKKKEVLCDVYNDQLIPLLEQNTKLSFRL